MNDGWAALLFRPGDVSDECLALGFALALAGYDVEKPRLDVAALGGLPGWSVAFYSSGVRSAGHDELAHQQDLFTREDLTPALGVQLAALHGRAGAGGVPVHSLVHGAAAGVDVGESLDDGASDADDDESADDDDVDDDDDDVDASEDVDDSEDDASRSEYEGASARLAAIFGRPLLAEMSKALFQSDRSLTPHLASPEPAAVAAVTARLVRALRRVEGRGGAVPGPVAGVSPPASYLAFAAAYDFADPADPRDLYRELAIGGIRGTLRFLRPGEAAAKGASTPGAYPVAELLSSHLTEPKRLALVALHADGVRLTRVDGKGSGDGNGVGVQAGPTFAELLRYLALGFSKRDALEEEIVSALMLRAAVRVA